MLFSFVVALSSLTFAQASSLNGTNATDYNNLTIALVRAAPANWPSPIQNKAWTGLSLDLKATVSYGISLVEQGAAAGANPVVFPETWFPG